MVVDGKNVYVGFSFDQFQIKLQTVDRLRSSSSQNVFFWIDQVRASEGLITVHLSVRELLAHPLSGKEVMRKLCKDDADRRKTKKN